MQPVATCTTNGRVGEYTKKSGRHCEAVGGGENPGTSFHDHLWPYLVQFAIFGSGAKDVKRVASSYRSVHRKQHKFGYHFEAFSSISI